MNMGQLVAPAPAPRNGSVHVSGHETQQNNVISRDTKGGRRLWYKLTVIQQPERARACGSGPKCESSYCIASGEPVVLTLNDSVR
jgi:hypothetical protein